MPLYRRGVRPASLWKEGRTFWCSGASQAPLKASTGKVCGHHHGVILPPALKCGARMSAQEKQKASERHIEELSERVQSLELEKRQLQMALERASTATKVRIDM